MLQIGAFNVSNFYLVQSSINQNDYGEQHFMKNSSCENFGAPGPFLKKMLLKDWKSPG